MVLYIYHDDKYKKALYQLWVKIGENFNTLLVEKEFGTNPLEKKLAISRTKEDALKARRRTSSYLPPRNSDTCRGRCD